MDPRDIKKYSAELYNMLVQGTVALDTIQGIELGFFDWIPDKKTITAQELSVQMGYDLSKVERWLRFAVANGYLSKSGDAYSLTPKGALLRRGTPAPDLLGLHVQEHAGQIFGLFRLAASYAWRIEENLFI